MTCVPTEADGEMHFFLVLFVLWYVSKTKKAPCIVCECTVVCGKKLWKFQQKIKVFWIFWITIILF